MKFIEHKCAKNSLYITGVQFVHFLDANFKTNCDISENMNETSSNMFSKHTPLIDYTIRLKIK